MTYDEAITQLCIGVEAYVRLIAAGIDHGPEGCEVYLLPKIKLLNEALQIVESKVANEPRT